MRPPVRGLVAPGLSCPAETRRGTAENFRGAEKKLGGSENFFGGSEKNFRGSEFIFRGSAFWGKSFLGFGWAVLLARELGRLDFSA